MVITISEVIVLDGIEPRCETFCNTCGDLRLWCRPEEPLACGGCGASSPVTGPVGGSDLPRLREQWHARAHN